MLLRGVDHPAVALALPTGEGVATNDEDLALGLGCCHEGRGGVGRAAILGTEVDRAIEVVASRLEVDLNTARRALIGHTTPLACHLQGGMRRAQWVLFRAVGTIVARGRNMDISTQQHNGSHEGNQQGTNAFHLL